jgi:A/G-specific adenine glycosylase
MASKVPTRFALRVLRWYSLNARNLPWRGSADPYQVWISEVMLQQTRVGAVKPYFERWMEAFPTITALAHAPEREVLSRWEGLGYYARARHLHRAARTVMERFGGELPADSKSLLTLPGIGKYTAGAISSIAFGLDEPALDGNIRRVLARVFNVRQAADSPKGKQVLWQLAAAQLPWGRAGEFNQALMDLGASICLPRAPRCGPCPVTRLCKGRRLGIQNRLPVLKPKRRVPHHQVGAAVIRRGGRVLLAHRPSKGLLGGLWEFPNAKLKKAGRSDGGHSLDFVDALDEAYGLRVRRGSLLASIQHAYSHFRVTVLAFDCSMTARSRNREVRWVCLSKLAAYPMGKVDRQIADRLRG